MAAIDQDLAIKISRRAAEVYADLEFSLMDMIASRLAADVDVPEWAQRKQAEITALRKVADKQVKRARRRGLKVVGKGIPEAYRAGAEVGLKDLKAIEIKGSFNRSSPQVLLSMIEQQMRGDVLGMQVTTALRDIDVQILRSTFDIYRSVIAEASLPQVLTGVETRRTAAMRALDRFSKRGITGFIDKANRNWQLESYVEMAVRTGSGHAMVQGRLDSYKVGGRDLVIVSDAPEECKVCRPWEGRILSISGADPKHASIASARAAGLFHADCRHDVRPYVSGLTKKLYNTKTADPEGNAERIRQRYLERQVRENKRRVASAESWLREDRGNLEAQANLFRSRGRLQASQGRLTDFIDESGRKRLRYREQIGNAI